MLNSNWNGKNWWGGTNVQQFVFCCRLYAATWRNCAESAMDCRTNGVESSQVVRPYPESQEIFFFFTRPFIRSSSPTFHTHDASPSDRPLASIKTTGPWALAARGFFLYFSFFKSFNLRPIDVSLPASFFGTEPNYGCTFCAKSVQFEYKHRSLEDSFYWPTFHTIHGTWAARCLHRASKRVGKICSAASKAEDAVNSIDWVAISVELIRRGTIRKWRRNETVYRRRWIWPLLIIVESNFGLLLQRRRGVKCDKKRLRIRSCSRLQLPRRSVGTQLSWYVDFSFFVLWILRPERAERIRGGLLFLLLFCSLPLLFWHGSDLHAALIAALATVTRQITNGFSWPYFIFLFKCQVLVTLKDFLANSLATH